MEMMQPDYNDVIQLMDDAINEDNNIQNEANRPLNLNNAGSEHTDTMNELDIDDVANNDEMEQDIDMQDDNKSNINYYAIPNGFYVRMMGVPFTSNHNDIIQFFQGLQIAENGIFFAVNCTGNRTGEVFVTFSTRLAMEEALKRHREYIDNRYIEVFETTKAKIQELVKISQGISIPQPNSKIFVIKLKGFSFDADEEKIRNFLGQLQPCDLHIIYDYKNRNSGTAFVQYLTQNEVIMVHKLNRKYLGNRYINVYPSNLNELRLALAQLIGSNLPYNLNPYLNCLRMEGLPLNIEHEEILSFFMRASVMPRKLHIKPNSTLAFAEFRNPFDSQLALTQNGSLLHGCSVYLIQVSKYELRSVIGGNYNQIQQTQKDENINNDNKDQNDGNQPKLVLSSNTNYVNQSHNNENRLKNCHSNQQINKPSIDYSYEYNNYHNNTRIDKENDNNMKHYVKQNNRYTLSNNDPPGPPEPPRAYNSQTQSCYHSPLYQYSLAHPYPSQYPLQCTYPPPAYYNNYNNHNNNNNNNNQNNNYNKHLVFIRGIPFDATTKDIIEFFKGYASFDTSAIKFINDARGRFTGQAIVSFFNRFEAKNACDFLDRKYIGRRYVLLNML